MKHNTRHWAGITVGILSLAGYTSAASLGSEKYTYDASGNIIEKQIDENVTRYDYEGNVLKSDSNGTTYTNDAAGKLTGKHRGRQLLQEMSYSYENKVTKCVQTGVSTVMYYNAEGHLVGKNASGHVETFAWDDLGLVMRKDQTFANEENDMGGIPAIAGDDVIVSDYIGNTLNMGHSRMESTAFGEGLETGFFTGKPFIDALDGFVFKHRNYSALESRWFTDDPLGFPDGNNNYRYTRDPHREFDWGGLIIKGAFLGQGTPIPSGNANYSKAIDGVTYTFKVIYDGFAGKTNDGSVTDLTLLMNPVIVPHPAGHVIPAAVRTEIALYFKSNCHGYTLGANAWLNLTAANIDAVFKGDGYKEAEDKDKKAIAVTYGGAAHSGIATHWTNPEGKVKDISHDDAEKHKVGTPSAHIPAGYDNPKYWEK